MQPKDLEKELFQAAKKNDSKTIKKLVEQEKVNINAQHIKSGKTALWIAASCDNRDAITELLKHNPDINLPDKYGWTPLKRAVHENKFESAQLLLAAGADVNQEDDEAYTPLLNAYNKFFMASELIKYGADVNHQAIDGMTTLILAAGDSRLNILQLLVREGALDIFRNKASKRNAGEVAQTEAALGTSGAQACADFLKEAFSMKKLL